MQAIELLSKAIILQEKLFGLDHPHVGFNYSTLSMYYLNSGYCSKGFDYMHKALSIMHTSVGENHPEIASIYLNLGMMYQEIENDDAAQDAYL